MSVCLIVDDDRLSCDIFVKILEPLQIRIVVKTDSVEALEFCANKMPDIMLLDLKMPKMDGFTFIKILRKMVGGQLVKIIACTGLSDAETLGKLKENGINGYLVKPFTAELLREKVNHFMSVF